MFESPKFGAGERTEEEENKNVEAEKGSEEGENKVEMTEPLNIDFYVTDHSADNADTGDPKKLKCLYKDIKEDGVKSVRYDWRWNIVEPKEGNFEEDSLERYGQAAEIMKEVGLEQPTVILSNIPGWALELYKEDKEKFFEEYQKYVERVKDRLVKTSEKTGELISRVQVLNELNNTVYTPIESEDLPRICEITRETLREYNPEIKLLGTLFAGNLVQVLSKATLGKLNMGVGIKEYLEKNKEILEENFDALAVDYYPGMWHVPLGEKTENKKEIFRQLGLLKEAMETIAGFDVEEYELGEAGIQTNIPLMSESHNEDRQRYFFDVFFMEFKHLLLDFQKRGIKLPKRVGLYEAMDEPPKDIKGKILRKLTPFPEHDMGMRRGDTSRKEILRGNRHVSDEERDKYPSQLSKIIKYMNSPIRKAEERKEGTY